MRIRMYRVAVMARTRCLSVCLLGLVLIGGALGQVASLCRPNERFLTCGCHKTCRDPAPECKGMCKEGCFCEEGAVRNDTGHCVQLADCPSIATTHMHTSEPRASDIECPDNEEYRFCEPCNRTCENPDPICPAQCARGCFCAEGLVRDKDGRCVHKENCSNRRHENEVGYQSKPIPYQLTCGPHQTYKECEACEKTCSSPRPICQTHCSAGCFCDEGYLKAPSGQCVKLESCPRAEVSIGGAQEPMIEDCRADEVFLLCGWCEPSCSSPRPECPVGVCTRGCLCRPPLVRHHTGLCVEEKNCLMQKCPDTNEEYVCKYGCEARCDSRLCLHRLRRCVLGCNCKLGLLRDVTGRCVLPDQCLNGPKCQKCQNTKRPDYKRYNETNASREDTSTLKSFFEVRTYMEIPNSHMPNTETEPKNVQKSLLDVFSKPTDLREVNPEIKSPKNFKDMVSLARTFYKDFADKQNQKSSEIAPKTFSIDFTIPDMTNLTIIKKADGSKVDDDSLKHLADIQTAAFKDNLNSYVNELISTMKRMLPQPINFTMINYPIW